MGKHVVIIYPHPDDESFGAAGTITQFRKQGVSVTFLCGTLGEMGRNMGDPIFANREKLPQIRKQELIAACEVLDMKVEMLGYQDKTLEFEDRMEVAQNLKEYLEQIKPSLVITHYPGYAVHPDHDALGAAAIQAVSMMDESTRPVVWAQAISRDYPEVLGEPDVTHDVSAEIDTKMKAIFSHTSQAKGVMSNFTDPNLTEEAIKSELETRFSQERFYIWKYKN